MATILINAFFKNAGVPATGLSPTIDIWNLDTSTLLVNDGMMTEVGGGNYKYSYVSYDPTVNYSFIVDGTATLSDSDRYLQAGNDDPTILAPKLPINYIMGSAVQTDKDDEIDAIKAKTDNLPASPAAVGSAMTLASGAITAAVIATDAIDADAIATDAVTEIQSGLATAGGQMNLTAAAIDEIFDELLSGHNVSGSFADFVKVIRKLLQNRYKHAGTVLTLYDDDSSTPLFTRTPKDKDGNAIDSANYSQFIPAEVTRAQ